MTTLALIALAQVLAATPTPEQAALERTAKVEEAHLAAAPDDTESLYRLGLAYLGMGQAKKALKPLRALVANDAENVDGKLLLARALRMSGEA